MTHSKEINWAIPSMATARDLEILWVTFVKLQRLRLETMADLGFDGPAHTGEPDLVDIILTPITTELCRLALAAADIEANCQEDIEYKAVMLAEFLSVEEKTVQSALTRSLVNDIKTSRCAAHSMRQPEMQFAIAPSA